MDVRVLFVCMIFVVHIFQAHSRTFTEEDCPGELLHNTVLIG